MWGEKWKVRHLHCPCTRREGPEELGAQNCTQPQCAPCGHRVCTRSQPSGQPHWWCSQGAPPGRDGIAPRWKPEGPRWFVSVNNGSEGKLHKRKNVKKPSCFSDLSLYKSERRYLAGKGSIDLTDSDKPAGEPKGKSLTVVSKANT